jgi:hypothetical protein
MHRLFLHSPMLTTSQSRSSFTLVPLLPNSLSHYICKRHQCLYTVLYPILANLEKQNAGNIQIKHTEAAAYICLPGTQKQTSTPLSINCILVPTQHSRTCLHDTTPFRANCSHALHTFTCTQQKLRQTYASSILSLHTSSALAVTYTKYTY